MDEDFRVVDPSVSVPDKLIEGLTVGAVVEGKVRGVNETDQGPFGAAAQATVI